MQTIYLLATKSIDLGQAMNKKEALQKFLDTLNIRSENLAEEINAISMLISKHKGDIVFLEGDKGEDLFFVLQGKIKLFKTSGEGKEITIKIVQENELFAEIVLFLKNRYPVSAIALENSLLLAINSKKIYERIKRNPEFAMKMIGMFATRLTYLTDKIKELSIDDARERLLNYLYHNKNDNRIVNLTIPKKEISSEIGISPETLSRTLKRLQNEGIITIEGKKIRLLK